LEGYFSIFKRGMKGVHQHCAEKHLHRYLAEFDFRYNNRSSVGVEDAERARNALKGSVGTAIGVLVEPLSTKPHEFRAIQIGQHRARYAVTREIDGIPPLVVVFTIDDEAGMVRLRHVEEADFPYGQL
jgi:hypothetical protein